MPSNRLEVDLKLLQDKNAEKLLAFGLKFSESVDSLSKLLGDYTQQIQGAAQASSRGAGGVGPSASVASQVVITGPQARMGGIPSDTTGVRQAGQRLMNEGYGGGGSSYGGGGGPSLPPDAQQRSAHGEPGYEQEYVRATRRIGENVPSNLRQLFGYMAEGQMSFQKPLYQIPEEYGGGTSRENIFKAPDGSNVDLKRAVDEEGTPLATNGQAFGKRMNEFLFNAESLGRLTSNMGTHLSNVRSGIYGNTVAGMNLGYGRTDTGSAGGIEGLFGGIGGPAWRQSVSNSFTAMKLSNFGLDPSFSSKQAKDVMASIQNYGWSGTNTGSWLGNFLKHGIKDHALTADTQMAFLDPLLRFGGTEDLSQLHGILNAIPGAAKAANMNLAEFQQQLVQVSQSVSEASGMTMGQAGAALTSFTATTGLDPSRAAALLSDPDNLYKAAAMSGKSLWQVWSGHDQLAQYGAFGEMQMEGVTGGMSPKDIRDGLAAPKNSSQYQRAQQAMSAAVGIWSKDHNAFGGLNPREYLNAATRAGSWKGVLKRQSVLERLPVIDISHATPQAFRSMIEEYAGSNHKYAHDIEHKMTGAYQDWLGGKGKQYQGNTTQDLMRQRKWKRDWLVQHLQGQEGKHANQAKKAMTIGLTSEASKWFKLLDSEYGGDKAHSSQWKSVKSYGRKAMHAGADMGALGVGDFMPAYNDLKSEISGLL